MSTSLRIRSKSSSGGFLGIGEEEHTIPWSKLTYDTNLGGYRTDITEEQLRGAPSFYRARDYDWSAAGATRSCTTIGARATTGHLTRFMEAFGPASLRGGAPWSNSRSSCPSSNFTRSGALNGFTPAAAT
jgi:hypothetical protein